MIHWLFSNIFFSLYLFVFLYFIPLAVVSQMLSHVQLCDPMNCSTSGFPVLHYLPEFAQTHIYWVSDTIQLSQPLFPASPSAFTLSQHQVFSNGSALVCQGIRASASASVLPMNIQSWFPLGLTGLISLQSKGLKSLLQQCSLKVSILWHSAFLLIQLSHFLLVDL